LTITSVPAGLPSEYVKSSMVIDDSFVVKAFKLDSLSSDNLVPIDLWIFGVFSAMVRAL
jgi:hypothetical protein